jgi:hypothetical protein
VFYFGPEHEHPGYVMFRVSRGEKIPKNWYKVSTRVATVESEHPGSCRPEAGALEWPILQLKTEANKWLDDQCRGHQAILLERRDECGVYHDVHIEFSRVEDETLFHFMFHCGE